MIKIKYWFVLTLLLYLFPLQSKPQEVSNRNLEETITYFKFDPLKKNLIINDYLLNCVDSGYFQLVSYLLMKGADPNSYVQDDYSTYYGYSALMLAAHNGYYNISELLIRKGANVNYQTIDGCSALIVAVKQLNDSITNLLIKNKAYLNNRDNYSYGLTPLQYSVGYNILNYSQDENYKIVIDAFVNSTKANKISELLINAGANVNITDSYGFTPLMVATQLNNLPLINALSKAGEYLNTASKEGITALMFAVDGGRYEICKVLIDNGANVNIVPPDGNTAIFAAIRANNDSLAELLIQKKAEINIQNFYGITPLHYAAGYGFPIMADLLMYYGAKLDITDSSGNTPLMASVYAGAYKVSELLINKNANVNKTDIFGNTPLMVATQFNDTTLIRMLYNAGADFDKFNNKRNNALTIAIENNSVDAFKMLIDLGAKADGSNNIKSYYQQAIEAGSIGISSFLISKGISTKLRPNIGGINFYTGISIGNNDFMVDFGGGVYEPITKILINLGYKYQPVSSRVLEYRNPEFYQFWEKRYVFYLSLQHLFVLKRNYNKSDIGFTPGISNELTWSKYRGLDKASGTKWIVVPSIGLFYKGDFFTVIGKWEVANYKKQVKTYDRFSFQLLYTLPNNKNSVRNKKIDWLD